VCAGIALRGEMCPARSQIRAHGFHQLGRKIQSVMPHDYKRDAFRRVPPRYSQIGTRALKRRTVHGMYERFYHTDLQ
jgi:hypothetical protein